MVIRCVRRAVLLSSVMAVVPLIGLHHAYAAASCPAASSCPGDLNGDGMVTINELITAVNAALYGCPPPGPAQSCGLLLSTGETQCDQGSGTLGVCPGVPPGQDAAVRAGVLPSYTDNGDGTIADNVTGLTWEKLSQADGSVHDANATYNWDDALASKIAALNTPPCFAGHCDWRLPNRRELDSLLNLGQAHPATDLIFNTDCLIPGPSCTVTACSCTQLDYYWSSSTYQDIPSSAWAGNFDVGDVNGFDKNISYYVRAVRGGL